MQWCAIFWAEDIQLHPLDVMHFWACRSELERLWPHWSFEAVSEEIWWLDHTEDKSDPKQIIPESDGELSCRKLPHKAVKAFVLLTLLLYQLLHLIDSAH